jgi:hypothetical protein
MYPSQIPPRKVLAQMLVGNQLQQAIYVVTKLGIADLLQDGPKRDAELAQRTGADPKALYRLLRALASFGIFAEAEQHRFELTPIASLLQKDSLSPMRAFALWSGEVSYQAFGGLEYSVLTGKPAFEQIFGMEFFDYLTQNPEVGNLFDELMSQYTIPLATTVAAYDFSGDNVIVDAGGGRGDLLAAILHAHPRMQGVLFEHPRVNESAKSLLQSAGVMDRCQIVCGDILESVPRGGDVYLLKSVIHGFDDDKATHVLRNCQHVMSNGSKVLLVEFVMPSGNNPFPGKLMDLLMLVGCYGRERTEEEFRSLFIAAGLRMVNMMTTKYGYSVIEGRLL